MPVCDPAPRETAVPGPFDAGVGVLLSGAGAYRDVPLYGMLWTGCFGWYRIVITSGGIRIWTGLVTKFLAGAPYGSPAA